MPLVKFILMNLGVSDYKNMTKLVQFWYRILNRVILARRRRKIFGAKSSYGGWGGLLEILAANTY